MVLLLFLFGLKASNMAKNLISLHLIQALSMAMLMV